MVLLRLASFTTNIQHKKYESVDKSSFINKNCSADTRQELGESSKQCITQIQKNVSRFSRDLCSGLIPSVVPLKDDKKFFVTNGID